MDLTYRKRISEGYNRLSELPVEHAELGALVLNGLCLIQESQELMDSIIHGISPFTEHFFHELATLPHSDESHWMNLVEDMAILFREHALKNHETRLPKEEARLLKFFESSGNWKPGDGTLVGEWYWDKLPALFGSNGRKKEDRSPE